MRNVSVFLSLSIFLMGNVQAVDNCKDKKLSEVQRNDCEKKAAIEKCQSKYYPKSNIGQYQKAFDDYTLATKEFKRTNPAASFPDSKSQLVTYKHDKYDEWNDSNDALRLNWATDLYKRSKGSILYVPGSSCATGSYCMDHFIVSEGGKSKTIPINSPYFKGFCEGVSALERRISLASNVYRPGDAACFNFIQFNPLVDGEAPGEGKLGFMKIGFKENGKISYDIKQVSNYSQDEVKLANGSKAVRENLEKDKSKFTLVKDQAGQLVSFSVTYENNRSEKVTSETSFKYINGMCFPYQKSVTTDKTRVTYPEIDKCLAIQNTNEEYMKFNRDRDVFTDVKIKLNELYDEFFTEGKLFYESRPKWCDEFTGDQAFACRTNRSMSLLSSVCTDYAEFNSKYTDALNKPSLGFKSSGSSNSGKSQ